MSIINVLMAGVGGQGMLLASEILALAALAEGLDAKQSEVHGVAQRGGSVVSHVRFGKKVHSPLARCGQVDVLFAGEQLEALRYAHYLKPDGAVVASDQRIAPIHFPGTPEQDYPDGVSSFLTAQGVHNQMVPALQTAVDLGDKRCANVVLLGLLSTYVPLRRSSWDQALIERLPKRILELNRQAFQAGVDMAAEH